MEGRPGGTARGGSGPTPPPPARGFAGKPVRAWTVGDVGDWLEELELGQYAEAFARNEIAGAILLDVGLDDLDYMSVTILAHRKVLLRAIAELKRSGHYVGATPRGGGAATPGVLTARSAAPAAAAGEARELREVRMARAAKKASAVADDGDIDDDGDGAAARECDDDDDDSDGAAARECDDDDDDSDGAAARECDDDDEDSDGAPFRANPSRARPSDSPSLQAWPRNYRSGRRSSGARAAARLAAARPRSVRASTAAMTTTTAFAGAS